MSEPLGMCEQSRQRTALLTLAPAGVARPNFFTESNNARPY
jgi:hypothetical protein